MAGVDRRTGGGQVDVQHVGDCHLTAEQLTAGGEQTVMGKQRVDTIDEGSSVRPVPSEHGRRGAIGTRQRMTAWRSRRSGPPYG